MSLPQVNAKLTSVSQATKASGGREDFEAPVDTPDPLPLGTPKWTGSEDAYYSADSQRAFGGEQAVILRRRLIIPTRVAVAAGIDTDDVVAFTFAGVPMTATAKMVSMRALDGIPDELQTTRLELADA